MRRAKPLSTYSTQNDKLRIATFNRRHPVGTQVRFWPSSACQGPGRIGTIGKTGGYLLGGLHPVVSIEGEDRAVFLSQIKPLDPGACNAAHSSHEGAEARHG